MKNLNKYSANSITFELAHKDTVRKLLRSMYSAWAKDYSASGELCKKDSSVVSTWFNRGHTVLIAKVDDIPVGFMHLNQAQGKVCLKIIYVRRAYRRKGVAKQMYRFAFESCNVNRIELSYRRVLKNLCYWDSLGIKSLIAKRGEGYYKYSLCYLSTEDPTHSICAVPLDRQAILRYKQSLGAISPQIQNNAKQHALQFLKV